MNPWVAGQLEVKQVCCGKPITYYQQLQTNMTMGLLTKVYVILQFKQTTVFEPQHLRH